VTGGQPRFAELSSGCNGRAGLEPAAFPPVTGCSTEAMLHYDTSMSSGVTGEMRNGRCQAEDLHLFPVARDPGPVMVTK